MLDKPPGVCVFVCLSAVQEESEDYTNQADRNSWNWIRWLIPGGKLLLLLFCWCICKHLQALVHACPSFIVSRRFLNPLLKNSQGSGGQHYHQHHYYHYDHCTPQSWPINLIKHLNTHTRWMRQKAIKSSWRVFIQFSSSIIWVVIERKNILQNCRKRLLKGFSNNLSMNIRHKGRLVVTSFPHILHTRIRLIMSIINSRSLVFHHQHQSFVQMTFDLFTSFQCPCLFRLVFPIWMAAVHALSARTLSQLII